MAAESPVQPLAGRLVIDFSTLLPGPMASLVLAEAGAEVVKVERPGTGDPMRGYPPFLGEESASFILLNRGKRSLALDLKQPDALDRLKPLIERADVLIEQFRPGVMDRLGFGYDAVAVINPRLIYCSITGYGQTGPKSARAGHDLNYQGDAGMLAVGHGAVDRPTVPPALIADIGGGAYPAVINILLALMARERTGLGCHLDIAMAEGLLPFLYWSQATATTGVWPGNADALVTGGTARYRLYPTQDGRLLAAAPIEQQFWVRFCDAIGLATTLRDDRHDPPATLDAVAAVIAGQSSEHWRTVFHAADCCCTIVATAEEAASDPHFAARGLFTYKVDSPAGSIPALPVTVVPAFRQAPYGPRVEAPGLGEASAMLG